ncbi:MAG: tetratricopeptide repeat protein [Saprospirales bacterium]|nr:tetratricopeptide repeat protein [Saprospirales bacterium]MBK8921464.1 tetratricopeptide repeat protein [Saprospirales bacterium]
MNHLISLAAFCSVFLSCEKPPTTYAKNLDATDVHAPQHHWSDSTWDHARAQAQADLDWTLKKFAAGELDTLYVKLSACVPMYEDLLLHKKDSALLYASTIMKGILGNMQTVHGELETGLDNFLAALTSMEEHFGINALMLDGCVGVATNYALRGDYEMAVYWQYKGINLSEILYPPGHPVYGNWHFNIAYFRSRQGDYERALEHFLKAAAIFDQSWYKARLVMTYERAANASIHLSNFDQARPVQSHDFT